MGILSIIGIIVLIWFVGSIIAGWNSAKTHHQEIQQRRPNTNVNSDDFVRNGTRHNNVTARSFIDDKFYDVINYDHSHELSERKSNFKTLEFENGNKYVGEVINGIMNGFGILQESNGTTIQGFWSNGKKNGVMIVKNSDIFRKNTYKNDVLHGLSYWADYGNNLHYLEYKNGKLVKLYEKYPDGNVAQKI